MTAKAGAMLLMTMALMGAAAPVAAENGSNAAILSDLARAVRIEAVQPPASLIPKLETLPIAGQDGARPATEFEEAELGYQLRKIIIKDYLPYYPYYALKGTAQHVIHPMGMGRFLYANSKSGAAGKLTNAALGVAFKLPNDGLAWYYPKHYEVARMLGDKLKYSSISQGTLLTGFTAMAVNNPSIPMTHARQTYLAMEWPFEKGGVNLAGRAVLEMPSFAGPPEIILNGWIDALLHIRDYAITAKDEEAASFFRRNIEFLTQILPNFDAPDNTISRYSDLSPYRVKMTLGSAEDIATARVLTAPGSKDWILSSFLSQHRNRERIASRITRTTPSVRMGATSSPGCRAASSTTRSCLPTRNRWKWN